MKPVPVGMQGELYIGGAGVARGYLNQPVLTAQRFIINAAGDRLYQTSDVVRWLPNGCLEYLGRNDEQVKVNGYRIELGEVENALNALAQVEQAVVIEVKQNLAAFIVGEQVDSHILKEQLPAYMIPTTFTYIDSIPLTANGKVDRRALPAPDFASEQSYTAPTTELEQQLCQIWQDVLDVEQVGVTDNFFAIGGNSISAIRLSARVRETLSTDLPLALLFEQNTIAGLASKLKSKEQDLLVIPRSTLPELPLSFAQERLLFIDSFEQGSNAYNIPHFVELSADVDLARLQAAFTVVINRHPVLKTTYNNQLQQVLEGDVLIQSTEVEGDLKQTVVQDISRLFDLSGEASIRLHHYLHNDRQYLLILWHHIAFDGWSSGVFMQELAAAYQQTELPKLDISYADYAIWQRGYLQGENLDNLLSYWQQQLSGFEALNLPTDHPRPVEFDHAGKNVGFELDETLSQQLRDIAKARHTTLYTVLLSGFYVTLVTLSGQDDIVIGTPSDNRHHAQTQSLIGFFVNSLALRMQVDTSSSIDDLIQQVHQQVIEAKIHQELPFEKLVDALNVERDPSRHPVYQVMFTLFNEDDEQVPGLPFKTVDFGEDHNHFAPAKFDLSLFMSDSQAQIRGGFNYAVNLFDQSTIERMIKLYQCVLAEFAKDQRQAVNRIKLVSEHDSHILRYDFNQTKVPFEQHKTLHQLFERQVELNPDNTALIYQNEQLSYRELNHKANQLAQAICPCEPETLFALYLDRGFEMMIAMLAVLKAGGAYVPLSPEHPKARAQFIVEDTQTPIIITQAQHKQRLQDWCPSSTLVCVRDLVGDTANFKVSLEGKSSATDLAYVIYTSGTTGQPKG
ncbi:MAG: condensation domain-containing protein, partial [Psychrosphaera sp.]|nr:condensation domain-containing protein [Psychrosphaera sp.]